MSCVWRDTGDRFKASEVLSELGRSLSLQEISTNSLVTKEESLTPTGGCPSYRKIRVGRDCEFLFLITRGYSRPAGVSHI